MDCHNLWCSESLSPKFIFILSKNFPNFWYDAIEKQSIINLSRDRNNGNAFIVLDDSEVTVLGERAVAAFVDFTYMFWLNTVLQRRSNKSSNFFAFHTTAGILSRPTTYLFLSFVRNTFS